MRLPLLIILNNLFWLKFGLMQYLRDSMISKNVTPTNTAIYPPPNPDVKIEFAELVEGHL